MTPLDLDGTNVTLDINQIGSSNLFKGDINADNYIGFFEFSGSSNIFDIQTDPTNTYSTDGSNVNISVTGTANDDVFRPRHRSISYYVRFRLDHQWFKQYY